MRVIMVNCDHGNNKDKLQWYSWNDYGNTC